jgi:uncharacterized protein with ParB-like and HNH nuclease domain
MLGFSVPRYQRNFAWSADETEELWDDLFGAVQRKGEYFLTCPRMLIHS